MGDPLDAAPVAPAASGDEFLRELGSRPRALDAHLGEIPPSCFDDHIYRCCELADRYATAWARELVRQLGLDVPLARGGSADEIHRERGFAPSFRPALGALLQRLAEAGELEAAPSGDTTRYRRLRPSPAPGLERLRGWADRLGGGATATLALFDAAAAAYPAVARGEASGEQQLFAPGRIQLWLDYFSNDNPGYVLNNRLAATVAANRSAVAKPLHVLEVGAGAGSATRSLLAELAARGRLDALGLYDFTEPSPFFRRRGERDLRALHPGLPLRFRAVDLDRPLAEQGCERGGYDLVFGVNVLHVARDLGRTLAWVREVLAPGGWLVAGECLRLFPGQSVPADLVFQLLGSFCEVELDPALRPHHGFLEPETWLRALAAAGFAEAGVVPDLARVRQLYPRFFTGVLCARGESVE